MVTTSLYILFSYLQHSLHNNVSSTPSVTSLLSYLSNSKLINNRRKENNSAKFANSNQCEILYPRRLKQAQYHQHHHQHQSQKQVKLETLVKASSINEGKRRITGLDMPVTAHYVAPRAPIVLCHGLYGFDLWGPDAFPRLQIHYWNGVEDALAKLGAKVIVTGVSRTGSIAQRAQQLHDVLKIVLDNQDVNFVAHSMGGLDCRHLLSHIKDRPYRVQSLTTICTPHRGSPVMDWFRDHVGVGIEKQKDISWQTTSMSMAKSVNRSEASVANWNIDVNAKNLLNTAIQWFDEPAYANLTTNYCNNYFNPNTPDDPSVAYYSYAASVTIPTWSSLLGLPWQLVKEKEGDNDGIVSVESAKWGQYVKTVQADHWDLTGKSYLPYRWQTDSSSNFDRIEFYMELATRLYHSSH
ncbi:hypothetical protein EC973_001847 [Apophysomyces ossiformis]|uniref:AB hydrolase-1 domain-containing protein n=1 Tax=Apophysomyces ossiformis TaxID=679940 RepID=A0A8H7BNE0_9FUNG|nr:hypothetical protein EC973_001847 [Apophysomyces ossiformis]